MNRIDQGILVVLDKQQLMNDIGVQCSQVGRLLQRTEEGAAVGADVLAYDSEENLPVIARAMSEAWTKVKQVCRAYLIMGRDTDDNRLEGIDERRKSVEEYCVSVEGGVTATMQLLKGVPVCIELESSAVVSVSIQYNHLPTVKRIQKAVIEGSGVINHTPSTTGEQLYIECLAADDADVRVTYIYGTYGNYELSLSMPATFNLGMTETIKASAHRMMVDYVMSVFLRQLVSEKSGEYLAAFDGDTEALRSALRARVAWGRRAPDWA